MDCGHFWIGGDGDWHHLQNGVCRNPRCFSNRVTWREWFRRLFRRKSR